MATAGYSYKGPSTRQDGPGLVRGRRQGRYTERSSCGLVANARLASAIRGCRSNGTCIILYGFREVRYRVVVYEGRLLYAGDNVDALSETILMRSLFHGTATTGGGFSDDRLTYNLLPWLLLQL